MPNHILNFKNIDTNNISFSKGKYYGKYCSININYIIETDKKCEMLIQGPKMTTPFGISKYDDSSTSYYLDMSFGDLSDELEEFYELIENIKRKCKRKRKKWNIDNQQFLDNIKVNDRNIYPPLLRLKIPMMNNDFHFNVFDDCRNKIDYNSILANSLCTPIFQVKNVWINESNYGITIQLLQLKVHISKILEDYSFIEDEVQKKTEYKQEDDNDPFPPLKDHPEYGIYFQMLKFKIPKESVINKMKFNNHNTEFLNYDENKSLEIQIKKKVNTSIQNNSNLINPINNNDLLSGLRKLKKPQKIEKIEKQTVVNSPLIPPSPQDLLNAMKKLKKSK